MVQWRWGCLTFFWRWLELRRLRHKVKVARLKADESLAAYYIKSHIEWDMKFAGDALDRTFKDEYLILLWSIPTVGLFVPGLRDVILPGFEALKTISDNAPTVFLYGWTTILAATFGVRKAMSLMYPNRVANLMSSMSGIRDDVPFEAADRAQANVDASASEMLGPRVY